jgi:hypothetical protein
MTTTPSVCHRLRSIPARRTASLPRLAFDRRNSIRVAAHPPANRVRPATTCERQASATASAHKPLQTGVPSRSSLPSPLPRSLPFVCPLRVPPARGAAVVELPRRRCGCFLFCFCCSPRGAGPHKPAHHADREDERTVVRCFLAFLRLRRRAHRVPAQNSLPARGSSVHSTERRFPSHGGTAAAVA